MVVFPQTSQVCENRSAKPYCDCFRKRDPRPRQLQNCSCGEDVALSEWRWQAEDGGPQWAVLDEQRRQVTFHPLYSAGTAVVRGERALARDRHHYWEVKVLTDTYGTDIMVGVGTEKVQTTDARYKFTSLLGEDEQSYGLSYRGGVRHAGARSAGGPGFCRGSLVGVRLDLWQGTLEFYVNRQTQGISFYNLRRHQQLYPMLCSTAAHSSLRLTYAASWRASLLVDAARVLAAGARAASTLPPGLGCVFRPHFWLLMPTEDCMPEEVEEPPSPSPSASAMEVDTTALGRMVSAKLHRLLSELHLVVTVGQAAATLSLLLVVQLLGHGALPWWYLVTPLYADFPSRYADGYYEDSVPPSHRLVAWGDVN